MKKKLILSCLSLVVISGLIVGAIETSKVNKDEKMPMETIMPAKEKNELTKANDNVSKTNLNTEHDEKETTVPTEEPTSSFSVSKKEEKQTIKVSEKSKEETEYKTVETKPVNPKPDSKPVETPSVPEYACLGGKDPNLPCDTILDSAYYYATYSSEQEAENQGEYYLNEVMYFGEIEITNYSVQPVYRNDHSIAYYGLNLWSNGQLIQ